MHVPGETDPGGQPVPLSAFCVDEPVDPAACVRACFKVASHAKSPCAENSFICAGGLGTADFGERYFKMAQMFGRNGAYLNICSGNDLVPALTALAERLSAEIATWCLPSDPQLDASGAAALSRVTVRSSDGSRRDITQGDGSDQYRAVKSPHDCPATKDGWAVRLNSAHVPGDSVDVCF
jgi:hypothetical protein